MKNARSDRAGARCLVEHGHAIVAHEITSHPLHGLATAAVRGRAAEIPDESGIVAAIVSRPCAEEVNGRSVICTRCVCNPAIREIRERERHPNGRSQVNRSYSVIPGHSAIAERAVVHGHGGSGRNINGEAITGHTRLHAAILNDQGGCGMDRAAVPCARAIPKCAESRSKRRRPRCELNGAPIGGGRDPDERAIRDLGTAGDVRAGLEICVCEGRTRPSPPHGNQEQAATGNHSDE